MDNTCFAQSGKSTCAALTVKKCRGYLCPFFKTAEEDKESQRKAYKRLAGLDKATQVSIASAYYGGKMPWLEGGVYNDR